MEASNKLIAEFMGIENTNGLVFQDANTKEFHSIKYHTSWDWLMPVVEKIENDKRYDVNILQYGTIICDNQIEIINNIANISFDRKIEHTYDAIVQFIKEYNKNN